MADPSTDPAQQAADAERKAMALAGRWIGELNISEKAQRDYLTRCKKIVQRYKKEQPVAQAQARRYALLWANTETIRPAVYSQPPQAIVSRRFKDADPVARIASDVLERGLTYSIDVQDLDAVLSQATFDFVLLARGTAWERYVPTHGPAVVPEIPVLQVTDDAGVSYRDDDGNTYDADDVTEKDGKYVAQGEAFEPVVFESSVTDFVNIEDFGTSVSRTWDEVNYVWRRVFMTREALIERFGEEIGKTVPLDWGPKANRRAVEGDNMVRKAAVYEIWDKDSKCVLWISKAYSKGPLDHRPDPLGLDNFFPCPRPLYGTLANDSLIPVPDYVFWQDQAEEIDELTARIATLQDALKVKGFYAGEEKTNLNGLFKANNNILIPVPGWQNVKDNGGLRGMIEWMPIDVVVAALKACIELRAQLKSDVDEITGISDIIRGSSDPRETATAAGLKGHWGPLRIRSKQKELARFARDVLRIKGEVIAEKFGIDTLRAMTGLQLPTAAEKQQIMAQIAQTQMVMQGQAKVTQAQWQQQAQAAQAAGQQPPPQPQPPQPPELPPQVQQALQSPTWEDVKSLLSDNASRQFRVDIETDSTIEPNETEQKGEAVEFVQAMGQFFAQIGPIVQAQPQTAPMFAEILKFTARRFRASRELEGIIDSTMDKLAAQPPPSAPQAAQPEPPDTTDIAVAQIEQQTAQIEQQGETQRAAIQAQIDQEDLRLRGADQQLKLVAITRDPQPQATA